jgi:hypothetical protein
MAELIYPLFPFLKVLRTLQYVYSSNSQGVDLRSGLALVRLAQSLQRLSGPFFILSQGQKLA